MTPSTPATPVDTPMGAGPAASGTVVDRVDTLVAGQALGVFALPAGYLLVPDGPGHDEVRRQLLRGRRPRSLPATLAFLERALDGDGAGALAALDALGDGAPGSSGADPVSEAVLVVDRMVLDTSAIDTSVIAALPGDLGVHAALVAYTAGVTDAPPAPDRARAPVLRALLHAAVASEHLEADRRLEALAELDRAAEVARPVCAPLAGQLSAAAAEAADRAGAGPAAVIERLRVALQGLEGTDLRVETAECHLQMATTLHGAAGGDRSMLGEAVKHYHATLQLVGRDDAPESWAAAHADLATAYLTMPMVQASDQLRVGVAIRSLRAALEVYQPGTHPERWAATQLNLANALVYAPSTHRVDNLVEAAGIYERVLEIRDRHSDPLGFARTAANLGNVLAHLGVFDQAHVRLHEARFIFEEFQDHEAVRSIRSVLDEIERLKAGADRGDPEEEGS